MPNPVMTAGEVREARRRAWLLDTITEIAADIGQSFCVVSNAIRGVTWGYIQDPPPVPSDYAPTVYRICVNDLCGDLYTGKLNGGLCQACYSHARGYGGEMRFSKERKPGAPPLDLDIEALYRRYMRGETAEDLAAEVGCWPHTILNHFRRRGLARKPKVDRVWTAAEVAQARTMHYEDGVPINEVAEHFDLNYLTVFDAVKWKTWRTAGGPMPEDAAALREDEKHPCEECGVMTRRRLCRYCREEMRERV